MLLRGKVYTQDIDGGVQIIEVGTDNVLLELSLAAAEDLSFYLKLSADAGRLAAREKNIASSRRDP